MAGEGDFLGEIDAAVVLMPRPIAVMRESASVPEAWL